MRLGRFYVGTYPIIECLGFWPVRLNLFHKEADCCPEVRSLSLEFVSRWGNGRGFELELTLAPAAMAHDH